MTLLNLQSLSWARKCNFFLSTSVRHSANILSCCLMFASLLSKQKICHHLWKQYQTVSALLTHELILKAQVLESSDSEDAFTKKRQITFISLLPFTLTFIGRYLKLTFAEKRAFQFENRLMKMCLTWTIWHFLLHVNWAVLTVWCRWL